jgi:hypothetical protein
LNALWPGNVFISGNIPRRTNRSCKVELDLTQILRGILVLFQNLLSMM